MYPNMRMDEKRTRCRFPLSFPPTKHVFGLNTKFYLHFTTNFTAVTRVLESNE